MPSSASTAAIMVSGTTISIARKSLNPGLRRSMKIAPKVKKLRIYFNNHYAGAAIINAMQFEEMLSQELSEEKKKMLAHARQYYSEHIPPKNQIA